LCSTKVIEVSSGRGTTISPQAVVNRDREFACKSGKSARVCLPVYLEAMIDDATLLRIGVYHGALRAERNAGDWRGSPIRF